MSRKPYTKTFGVRWADLDPNRHMRNTAYLDYATEVRFAFLADHNFPPADFTKHNIGPVIFREEMRFLKEVGPNDEVRVDYRVAGLSDDGRKFRLRHRLYRGDGEKAAEITTDGAWMDLATRKLRVPPPELRAAIEVAMRTEDFEEL